MARKWTWLAAGAALAGAALTAKLVSRPADVAWEDNEAEWPHAEHSRFIKVDGVRMRVLEVGPRTAPTVVLIHGYCASSASWSKVIEPLAASGLRIIAPDLVGYGFSEKPLYAEYTVHYQSRMILRLLNRLGIGRAMFVGASYGGAVAATCALEAPERVEKLVLVDAVSTNSATKQVLARLASAPLLGAAFTPLLLDSKQLFHKRIRQMYHPSKAHLYDAERAALMGRPLRAAGTHNSVLMTMRRWDAEHVARNAHLITAPTLLMWGENDRDVPLSEGRHLFQAIPDARLIIFRGCGHVPQEELPEEFVEVLTNYLHNKLPYTRTPNLAEGSKLRDLPAEDDAESLATQDTH